MWLQLMQGAAVQLFPKGKEQSSMLEWNAPFHPIHVNLAIRAWGNITAVFSTGKVRHKEMSAWFAATLAISASC